MFTLYYAPGAASMVVHWLLIELQAPHELRKLNLEAREHKQPEYLKLNPAGLVPTLLLDGKPVCEAAAIVLQLADLHPKAGLAPALGSPERAQYYKWMFFMANTLQPAYRAWFYPDEPAGEPSAAAAKEQARQRIESAWERLATHLAAGGPYLLGEKLSAADFMMTMLMRWSRNMPRPAHSWPALLSHAQRMKGRPSFAELYAREGLTEWA
mgnify:CR=1 FL=1|jgi:glutathione S-transferase